MTQKRSLSSMAFFLPISGSEALPGRAAGGGGLVHRAALLRGHAARRFERVRDGSACERIQRGQVNRKLARAHKPLLRTLLPSEEPRHSEGLISFSRKAHPFWDQINSRGPTEVWSLDQQPDTVERRPAPAFEHGLLGEHGDISVQKNTFPFRSTTWGLLLSLAQGLQATCPIQPAKSHYRKTHVLIELIL